MKFRRKFFLFSLPLALLRCGYTGDPLPPALMIPQPVADLSGFQLGEAVLLRFTLPEKTTEDLVLARPPEIELRAAPNPAGGFDMERWLAASERLPAGEVREGKVEARLPARPWAGKEMVFAVRTIGPRGRASKWSNLLVLRIVPPLRAPAQVRAEATGRGILVSWQGDGTRWRVWRSEGKEPVLAAEVAEPRWLDTGVQYGSAYEYTVQQVADTGAGLALSEPSAAARVQYEDVFPPAPPAGLRVIAGAGTIELNWERNTEPDFKAFQVWRAENGGPLVRLGEPLAESSFSDANIVSGRRYRYAVSAIDEKGNESRPCEPVEIVAP